MVKRKTGKKKKKELSSFENYEQEWSNYEFPDRGQTIIIFGTGLLGQTEVPLLKQELNIIAFCDNNKEKQNSTICGLPCIAPGQIKEYSNPFVLISTIKHYFEIAEQMRNMGIKYCTVDAYVVRRHGEKFFDVFRLLDQKSKYIYAQILKARIRGDTSLLHKLCSESQYFALPQFRYCRADEVFVDCGAFVGDIVQKFIENNMSIFDKIYAFEPEIAAFSAMRRRIDQLQDIWLFRKEQIVCEQKGVGEESEELSICCNKENAANGSFQAEREGENKVEVIALDRYFFEYNNDKITFLKADVEGYEWNLLQGAKKLIQKNRPKIAIAMYHNIFDFYRLVFFLKELVPEYRFAVRHHWNSFDETILYCYVEQ